MPPSLNPKKLFVVAVSGTSGAGKSSLTRAVAARLDPVIHLSFDDYISLDNTPAAIQEWLANGADPSAFRTPQLTVEIERLLREETSAGCLLVEDPFGRSRPEMAEFIDLSAFLELPRDIALARRLVRSLEERKRAPEALLDHMLADLRTYLAGGREAYTVAERHARETADVILDGARPVAELAAALVDEINRRRLACHLAISVLDQ